MVNIAYGAKAALVQVTCIPPLDCDSKIRIPFPIMIRTKRIRWKVGDLRVRIQSTADGVVRALPPAEAATVLRKPTLSDEGILTVINLKPQTLNPEHPTLNTQPIPYTLHPTCDGLGLVIRGWG